ncbi:MAG: 1-phosphofructokinase family hexose kinase [Bryobacterales bacterium]|nr:1-phosphofructokinase family hexose kinase [Bryobacterales bacterium]
MILTLTINPAIDRNLTADRLAFEDRAYITSKHDSPGGRGINASCVIHAFGAKTLALLTSGGTAGARLEAMLNCCGFPIVVVPVQNEIRTNLTISDRQGLTIKLNEHGPAMDEEEVKRVQEAVIAKLPGASWLMMCGSTPPGVPADFYARLIVEARREGVKTLLDTDGEALREGLRAHPTVVAPNQPEAERLLNTVLITRTQVAEAAARIRSLGAEAVVLSLGSQGAVASNGSGTIQAIPPPVDVVCPIGAGDALAAAFTWSMRRKGDFPDAVRWGVAAGTASARLPGVSFASLEQAEEVYKQVEVRDA